MRVVAGLKTLWGDIDEGIKFVVSVYRTLFGSLLNGVKFLGNLLMAPLRDIMGEISFVRDIFNDFWGFIQSPINMMVSFLQMISNRVKDFTGVMGKLSSVNDVKNAVSSVGNVANGILSGITHLASGITHLASDITHLASDIAHLASDGLVVPSGLTVTHKVETVVPAGKTMGEEVQQNSFHIEINVHGVTNPKELADIIQKEFESRTGRMLRWSS